MSRIAFLGCVLMAGCFYTEAINQRPSIDIRQTSADEVYRKSTVTLEAVANDPEGQLVFFQWRGYSCTDANDFSTCDSVPFYTEILDKAAFEVPARRVDVDLPVESILVVLEAKDDYGAIARPKQQLILAVSDHPPELTLSMSPRHGYVIDTTIDLFAKVADPDDGPASTQPLTWTVFSPMNQPGYDFVDLDVADPDPTVSLQLGKRFKPKGVGKWEIQVDATDPLGIKTTKSLVIDVVPDHAPCLSQWSPLDAPVGTSWPLTGTTLFQVGVVTDDLDPYPTVPGDTELGSTKFAWSIQQPGASTHTAIQFAGSGIALDPANYAPGDIVELRVEIADRNNTPITCADGLQTCSVISDDSCIQRLTWRVEVR